MKDALVHPPFPSFLISNLWMLTLLLLRQSVPPQRLPWINHSLCHDTGRLLSSTSMSHHGVHKSITSVKMSTMSTSQATVSLPLEYRAFLGVGSNMGDKFRNIQRGLELLCQSDHSESTSQSASGLVRLVRTSFLYQTAPMYVTDQPSFLNGALEVETNLTPVQLLDRIKQVEQVMGRDANALRNGPRPLDLDILLYDQQIVNDHNEIRLESVTVEDHNLTVPHPLMTERDFVLTPLLDVTPAEYVHPGMNQTLRQLHRSLIGPQPSSTASMNDPLEADTQSSVARVLPLPHNRLLCWNNRKAHSVLVMGILNVTPDSFSDGGQWISSPPPDDHQLAAPNRAVEHALEMEREGASIIDIGGESTRPGAQPVSIDEELQRTIPVIEGLRKGKISPGQNSPSTCRTSCFHLTNCNVSMEFSIRHCHFDRYS